MDVAKGRRFGAGTRNGYLRAAKGLTRWMVRDGQAQFNPLVGLSTVHADMDVRVQRRVLSADEFGTLLSATAKGRDCRPGGSYGAVVERDDTDSPAGDRHDGSGRARGS